MMLHPPNNPTLLSLLRGVETERAYVVLTFIAVDRNQIQPRQAVRVLILEIESHPANVGPHVKPTSQARNVHIVSVKMDETIL
jgi:hypothetical protein